MKIATVLPESDKRIDGKSWCASLVFGIKNCFSAKIQIFGQKTCFFGFRVNGFCFGGLYGKSIMLPVDRSPPTRKSVLMVFGPDDVYPPATNAFIRQNGLARS